MNEQFSYGWESITPIYHEPSEVAAARNASIKAWATYLASVDEITICGMQTPWETQRYSDLIEASEDLLAAAQRAEQKYHRIYRENGEREKREADNGKH